MLLADSAWVDVVPWDVQKNQNIYPKCLEEYLAYGKHSATFAERMNM